MRLLALIALVATPAAGGVDEAIDAHVLPAAERFAEQTAVLSAAARTDCRPEALRPEYQAAFDAWMGLAHLRLGPLEEDGRALAIAFWPDVRGMVPAAVSRLIAEADPVVSSAEDFAEVSVAARGLFALERLLYEPDLAGYGVGDYTCDLVQAVSADLARMASEIEAEWRVGYAETLRAAGAPGNEAFLSEREAAQALYTTLTSGLEFVEDQRLGRPLGTFERPRPELAEARRAGRSLRNVILSLEALRDLARALSDAEIPQTEAAFTRALEAARSLDDPVLAGVGNPQGRLEVEILAQHVAAIRDAVAAEVGAALGVAAGFNATDGD